jgi:hypothetical protein
MLLRKTLFTALKRGSALLKCASQEATLCLVAAKASYSTPALLHSPGSSNLPSRATRSFLEPSASAYIGHAAPARGLASSAGEVVTFPLAQTGEGISECELMQWFVKVR